MEYLHDITRNHAVFFSAAILVLAYVLIASEKISKVTIALIGACAAIILGLMAQEKSTNGVANPTYYINYIDFNVVFLLIAMMILVMAARAIAVVAAVLAAVASAFHLFDFSHKFVENSLQKSVVLDCFEHVVAVLVFCNFINEDFVLVDIVEFLDRFQNDKPFVIDVERCEVIKIFVFVCDFVVQSDDVVVFGHIVLVVKKICHSSFSLRCKAYFSIASCYFDSNIFCAICKQNIK